jgi:hypothetical protein
VDRTAPTVFELEPSGPGLSECPPSSVVIMGSNSSQHAAITTMMWIHTTDAILLAENPVVSAAENRGRELNNGGI